MIPDNATIHEQKAQVLLELGDAWRALTAATSNFLHFTFVFFLMNDLFDTVAGLKLSQSESNMHFSNQVYF